MCRADLLYYFLVYAVDLTTTTFLAFFLLCQALLCGFLLCSLLLGIILARVSFKVVWICLVSKIRLWIHLTFKSQDCFLNARWINAISRSTRAATSEVVLLQASE